MGRLMGLDCLLYLVGRQYDGITIQLPGQGGNQAPKSCAIKNGQDYNYRFSRYAEILISIT